MKKITLLITTLAALISCSHQENINDLADRVFNLAVAQYTSMNDNLAEGQCPKTLDKEGKLVISDIGWWCSGFYPGSLWYIYEFTADENIKAMAEKHTLQLENLNHAYTDHDIGFQINNSYGHALRLTGEEKYRQPIINAAYTLAARFTPETGVTKSWNWGENWKYPVIIDNMMNMELLTDAYEMCGEENFRNVAVTHANTTLKNHFREDWTTWHLVDYDPENGSIRGKQTVQGYADDSAWARGQAWALYGYTMMYRETGIKEYLDAAINIGNMLIGKLPEDGIPYWDFNAPDIPEALRDASAGAIMASAFTELGTLTGDEKYLQTAFRQISTLASEEYLAEAGTNENFLLKHSVGSLPGNSEVDVPLTYADYYFLEAILRYRRAIL